MTIFHTRSRLRLPQLLWVRGPLARVGQEYWMRWAGLESAPTGQGQVSSAIQTGWAVHDRNEKQCVSARAAEELGVSSLRLGFIPLLT